jgi:predicted secreted hydrolase
VVRSEKGIFVASGILSCFFLLFFILPARAWLDGYLLVTGPCDLTFPADHGAHPGYRTEWWYYTGNVAHGASKKYGFQLTFFRTRLLPPGDEKSWPSNPSPWRTDQVFLAHAALTDIAAKRFFHDEKVTRGAADLAGVEQQNGSTTIFLERWSANIGSSQHRLKAFAQSFSLDLSCEPLKPLVLHGTWGYSLKGKHPESASCYYSFTRLETSGTLTVDGKRHAVRGTAWMDHEFSSTPLEQDLVGWDWFGIQLNDNTELMVYLLRRHSGGYSEASSGTFVSSSGEPLHLSHTDTQVEILDHWKSPHSGATYPSRWRMHVLPLDIELTIVPNLADQELVTNQSTQVTYWEGSVSVAGKAKERLLEGVGYVEMTGYAKPFNLSPTP